MKWWNNDQDSRFHTLRLSRPDGRSLILPVLLFLIYLICAELVVRIGAVQDFLGAPRLGNDHRGVEQQWFRLKEQAEQGESINCIFLGDSTVMTDFSPIHFADAYFDKTGDNLVCHNFGVGAFTAVGFSTLAQILIQEYSPRLLVVGVQPLDFTLPKKDLGFADISGNPWVRYKLGEFTLEGWLYEHTYLYPYLAILGQLATFTVRHQDMVQGATGDVPLKDGYYPLTGLAPFDVSNPPNPEQEHPYLEFYFAALSTFQLLPENLNALDDILALENDSTQIILVDMPLPETFYPFFGQGEKDYKSYLDTINQHATEHSIPFLEVSEILPALSGPYWFNYNHLNSEGAPIFSGWLGTKLGEEMQFSVNSNLK